MIMMGKNKEIEEIKEMICILECNINDGSVLQDVLRGVLNGTSNIYGVSFIGEEEE